MNQMCLPPRESVMASMEIDVLEAVELGGIRQWIRVRGSDRANPVLLLMQQGPGLPIINDVRHFERSLALEQAFTVVYWDQRGAGLSALPLMKVNRFEITVDKMVSDTVSLLELLRERYGHPPIVAGFSFGATFAAYAALQRPDLVSALVAVGMDIDVPAAEQHTYDFVRSVAAEQANRRAMRQLEKIGPPPHVTVAQFGTRARWAANFGGVTVDATYSRLARTLVASLVRSSDYSAADTMRTLRGINASRAALLPQLAGTDLITTMPRLDVPIVLAQGRLDQVTPGAIAQRFYDSLSAPSKHLVWFGASAHTPQLDEPDKLRHLLLATRDSRGASVG